MRVRLLLPVVAMVAAACAAETSVPFEVHLSPEFVQGMIPGSECPLLVTIESDSADPVTIGATAVGASVVVTPTGLVPGQVGEIRLVADAVEEETPMSVTVTATRDDVSRSVTMESPVLPWTDTVAEEAARIRGVFTSWLEANRPDLGITTATRWEGSAVAPQLLVVSHYLFESAGYELGVSWHIMIPPDDWAEIYLRPRSEQAPTLAFRLASRSAALDDGVIDIGEVTPPVEVVR